LSADPTAGPQQQAAAPGEPTEQQLREAYEAELSRITATDMIGQSAVSLLNIGARRLGAPGGEEGGSPAAAGVGAGAPGRDLDQVRDAIDGARALLEILERRIPQELGPLRDALSRLQMAYAREIQQAPAQPAASAAQPAPKASDAAGGTPAAAPPKAGEASEKQPGPGPAEASGRLWVPGR
jgi:hypothetical protein